MQNFKAENFPRFEIPSYAEIEAYVERGRQMRSAAAFGFFADMAGGIAGGVSRAVNGLRDRESTRWPARLDPGRKAG
ncbi:MAG: hypothetical protein WDZ84_10595 [Rhodovibrionaceae bacterium]